MDEMFVHSGLGDLFGVCQPFLVKGCLTVFWVFNKGLCPIVGC